MLHYKYEQEFGSYLEKIYICSIHELPVFDISKIDYVFTTVPIHQKIPVPIIEVGQFLGREDIAKVKGILERGTVDFLDYYYQVQNFLVDVPGNNREEVIKNICTTIGKTRNLPEGFIEAVLEREHIAETDFGNHIAMPHPYRVMTNETFIYVAILEKEIIWGKYPVQFVLLASICDKEDKNLPRFYDATTRLLMEEDKILQIIKAKKFSVLMQMLRLVYYMEQ